MVLLFFIYELNILVPVWRQSDLLQAENCTSLGAITQGCGIEFRLSQDGASKRPDKRVVD